MKKRKDKMKFKVIIDYCESNLIEINVDDPESAAKSALKLFQSGRIKPLINEISVFDLEDELGFEPPIYVLRPSGE